MRHRLAPTLPLLSLLTLAACSSEPLGKDTAPLVVPWDPDLPVLSETIEDPRGFVPLRAHIHLHSPYSHDACDGAGYVKGVFDESCLQDLRDALCRLHTDHAFVTDHPAYAAEIPWEDWLLSRGSDELLVEGGAPVANLVRCDDGHELLWQPGIEDELMPLGLERHAAEPGEEAYAIYDGYSAEAIAADAAAGATVFVAHTEGHATSTLATFAGQGLSGLELFNLHAMLDPDNRVVLGLDPYSWTRDIGPFTSPDGDAEPDLMFLGFFEEQRVIVERWDALLVEHNMIGVAGTDAHRNVMPWELRDGERADGYRRMMRWFSNTLLAAGKDRASAREALAAGRLYASFDVFGIPEGFAFWYQDPTGAEVEMGSSSRSGGTLHLECPSLSSSSPQDGGADPEISARIYKDGLLWQEGCGEFLVEQGGAYRARVDIVPLHLQASLGADPEPYLHEFPWIYSNAIRLGE